MSQPSPRILIYLLRRDLRLADNPVLREIARVSTQSQKPFTHLLPVYVFPANQIEVSGFLASSDDRSPYPQARSQAGGFWRCGRLRAKFIAESVWDMKKDLESCCSGLEIRVGAVSEVVRSLLDGFRTRNDAEVHGLWMTSEEGWEEKIEESQVKKLLEEERKEFKLWTDEKYFIDDRDLPFQNPQDLSDVFTTFRKTVEPLRAAPRDRLPKPEKLPPLPDDIPLQNAPFQIPTTLQGIIAALWKPLREDMGFSDMPTLPKGAQSAHPFQGGSTAAHDRLNHLIESGSMTEYNDTRNGLLGLDFSTKLSAWLCLGCITAREVHWKLMDFEDGRSDLGRLAKGFGQGENKGTSSVRFELLWRDYMRLCTRKFGTQLFLVGGYRQDKTSRFKFINSPFSHSTDLKGNRGINNSETRAAFERFIRGQTGTGLIDASQRELFLTGWTSNRARQNVASFLTKHLGIDWRLGAEWYEANLVDYDVSSNWGNWQYVAGVGNDPRGDARVFNPVKQALNYDVGGEYIRAWVPELRDVGRAGRGVQSKEGTCGTSDVRKNKQQDSLEDLMGVFQAWRLPVEEKRRLGLEGVEWVEKPLIRINFSVNRGGGDARRGRGGGGGSRGKGGRGRGPGKSDGGEGRGRRSGLVEKAGWNE